MSVASPTVYLSCMRRTGDRYDLLGYDAKRAAAVRLRRSVGGSVEEL